jgi:SAM-dependent methyltransferase
MANAPSKPHKGCGMEGLVAAWYARQTARDGEEIRQTARRIAAYLNSGSRVLEVAPGPGYLAIEVAWLSGAFVTGLDVSRSFVGIARENASKAGVRVDFEHGDAADLPFPDTQFDFIVCRTAFKEFHQTAHRAQRDAPRAQARRQCPRHRFAQAFFAARGEGLCQTPRPVCRFIYQTDIQYCAKETRLHQG